MLTDRGTLIFALRDPEGLMEVIDQDGIRSLYFGTRARQSSMRLTDPAGLVLEYTQGMLAALLFQPQPHRILMIGLGGGSLARFLLRHLPNAQIDCSEPRAGVIDLARRYFQLPDTPQLAVHISDGAEFLRHAPEGHYDLILVDAFDSEGVHPSVCSRQFHADCRRALRAAGVLSINLWITPGTGSQNVLKNMELGFAKPVLRLPVEQRANLIALAPVRNIGRRELKQLREPARELAVRLGLDFPGQLRRLERANTGLMRRILHL